ncbi:hypothetical protein B0T22DRAFT_518277 [Podospora appendiculata]|uniref:F-box domain-containing protein n=1 Tax=Podospora appendiculata TaxID=314037 RepID=A0AAE1CAV4_9PEZI|nr:hypothetical protein B0T22DRAFT_518277 [Podospora appendiculata]
MPNNTTTNTDQNPCPFLTIPLELRLEIYTHLLTLPTTTTTTTKPTLHPAILTANHQTYTEALPLLYTQNTFLAHPHHLTSKPQLLPSLPPITSATKTLHLIRRWRLRVRLDALPPPTWTAATLSAAFTGADELVLDLWQGAFFVGGAGAGTLVLSLFEGIRGVRRVCFAGVGAGDGFGFGRYLAWLARAMRKPRGSVVGDTRDPPPT